VIVGVGMTLVIATGGIDLSVGSLMAIAGALAPLIFLGTLVPMPHPYLGVALAFVIPVLAAGAFGWFNGWLITRFRIQPIIATLVLFIAGRGIAQVMTNGNLQVFKVPEFQFIGLGACSASRSRPCSWWSSWRPRPGCCAGPCSAGRSWPSAATSAPRGSRACPSHP
jgi:ribose transport system permease protein